MGVSVDSSYFQRLSLCETIRRTINVIISDVIVFAQLGFITVGVYAIVWASLQAFVLIPAFNLDPKRINDPDYFLDDNENQGRISALYTIGFMNVLFQFFMTAIGNGALVRAVAELYLHRQPSLKTCVKVGIRHSIAIIVASFLAYVVVVLGFFIFVLPGFYFMVNWFLVNPVIIIEGLGAIGALKRSWNLVSDRWCYVFGTYIVALAFMTVIQLIWQTLFTFSPWTFFGSIMNALPSLVFNPILAVMMTIMYINLRIEKEGLNAEMFSRELGIVVTAYSSLITHDDEDVNAETDKAFAVANNVV